MLKLAFTALLITGIAFAQQPSILDRAQKLDEAGKCAEAEALYQTALRSRESIAVLNNFGNHYLACNQPGKAIEIFSRVLKIRPDHVNANLQMARLAVQRHEPARALAYLDRIANPDSEVQIVRAEALAATGRAAQARTIAAGVAKSSSDPRILYAVAMMCARAGLYAEAEAAFERVLTADPGDTDLLFNLGAAAARAGHYERARDAFSAILKSKPNDPGALYELGRVEASLGDNRRAIYLLAQAKQAQPRRAEISLALARAAEAAGYYGDAIEAYDAYLALRPEDQTAARDRALVAAFTRAGHDSALKELQNWVTKHPDDAVGHYDLALAQAQTDRSAALEETARAIALNPRLPEASYFRAWLLQQSGDYEASVREARAALGLKPDDARVLDLLGLDYLDLSRATDAEPLLRKAAKILPDNPDIVFHLGRCVSELGRSDEAKTLMARFQQLRREPAAEPREQPGIIEAATLPPDVLARRVASEYREAVAANPNDPGLRLRFAEALLSAGDKEQGVAVFRELLATSPPADLCRNAGKALLANEEYELAAGFLRRAVVQIPEAAIDLAVAELFSSGPDAALSALKSASAGEQTGDIHVVRAAILEAAGKDEAALAEMKQCAGATISRPWLAREAALLLMRHGQAKQALDVVDRSTASRPEDRLLRLTRVAVLLSLSGSKQALEAASEIRNRWPEWDGGYLAEAVIFSRNSRSAEAKSRLAMAEALGAEPVALACVNRSAAGQAGCSCKDELWAALAGCSLVPQHPE